MSADGMPYAWTATGANEMGTSANAGRPLFDPEAWRAAHSALAYALGHGGNLPAWYVRRMEANRRRAAGVSRAPCPP